MKKLFLGFALIISSLAAQAQDLVTNGDFENGFDGWTKSTVSASNQQFVTLESNGSGLNHFYSSGTVGEMSFLSQSVNTTKGTYYDLSFILRGTQEDASSHALVTLGGAKIVDEPSINLGSFTQRSFRVQGLGGLMTLSLGAESVNSFIHFDNVAMTVSAVPEPETYAMMLFGLGMIGYAMRRRQRG